MSETASKSVLARKVVARTAARPPAPSDSASLDAAVLKAAKGAVDGLMRAEIDAAVSRAAAGALGERMREQPDAGVYYWTFDDKGAPAALFSVSHVFAAWLTDRLLGGEITAPDNAGPASALSFDMSAALLDVFCPLLAEVFTKTYSAGGRLTLNRRRGMRLKKEVLADREGVSVHETAIDLSYADGKLGDALIVYLASAYTGRLKLEDKPNVSQGGAEANKVWSTQLKRSVLACEIPLAAVLERLSSNIGELSRLAVGQTIDLSAAALSDLDISVATNAGPIVLAKGRLGAIQANKAVKLTTPIDPDFLEGL